MTPLLTYRENGIDIDAMLNYLLRMGWTPTRDDKSMATISKDKAVELFVAGGKMRASNANIDPAKLASYDRKHRARKLHGKP